MATVEDSAVVQRPNEPIVQQAETEIVDETKYVQCIKQLRVQNVWLLDLEATQKNSSRLL